MEEMKTYITESFRAKLLPVLPQIAEGGDAVSVPDTELVVVLVGSAAFKERERDRKVLAIEEVEGHTIAVCSS